MLIMRNIRTSHSFALKTIKLIFHSRKARCREKSLFARKSMAKALIFFWPISQIKGKEGNLSQTAISNAMTNAKID